MTGLMSRAYYVYGKLLSIIGLIRYQALERQFVYTMRIGLVVSTILLTVITAVLISERGLIGLAVVGGIGALCILIFVYRYFTYAILALMITTTIAAPSFPRDITTTLLLLLLLSLIWLVRLLLVERSFQSLHPVLPNRFIPLFILAVIISFIWSINFADTQIMYLQNDKFLPRLVTAMVLILSPIATLLFGNFVRTIAQIKWIIWYYIIFGAFIMIFKISQLPLPAIINWRGQLPACVGIFALGQLLYNDALARWQRLALLTILGGWIYISFRMESTWLSGWVPLLVGICIVILLRSRALFALLLAIAAIYILTNWQYINSLVESENEESGGGRMAAGSFVIDIANKHFLFGTGPTGYYFYVKVKLNDWFQLSHNNYIDIYAQTGIFGFASYLLVWASIGWTVWRTYRLVPKHGFMGGLAASLVAAFFITMLIMMLGDWVTPFTYTQSMRGISYTIWPWLWGGLAIALGHIAAQTQIPQLQADSTPPGQG